MIPHNASHKDVIHCHSLHFMSSLRTRKRIFRFESFAGQTYVHIHPNVIQFFKSTLWFKLKDQLGIFAKYFAMAEEKNIFKPSEICWSDLVWSGRLPRCNILASAWNKSLINSQEYMICFGENLQSIFEEWFRDYLWTDNKLGRPLVRCGPVLKRHYFFIIYYMCFS